MGPRRGTARPASAARWPPDSAARWPPDSAARWPPASAARWPPASAVRWPPDPRLFVGRAFLAVPDCWSPDAGVVAEVDSRAWHLSPQDWENTLARQARMAAAGIIVLHFPPNRIHTEPKEVIAEIRSALSAGQGRSLPHVRTLPAR
jgi:hypothetical protein